MPTSTDLVTDLPADFETFGQAVATSMADLLGGTTGQVLSKASNTNMDFTWVTSDDANAIQNAIVDAKGDLIAASAADTPARLAVGANNSVLVPDSTTATGLKYTTSLTGLTTVTTSADSEMNGVKVGRGGSSVSTNTAVGFDTMTVNTTGSNNTGFGRQALRLVTTGTENLAVGNSTLTALTTGSFNVAVGLGALNVNNANNNTAVGEYALTTNSSGSENTAVGWRALDTNSSGNFNTSIGLSAGNTNTTGSNNTMLGYNAQASSATVSNTITLGNASVGTLRCQVTSITALSDERDKKNIEPLQVGLDFVNTLKPVTFDWNYRQPSEPVLDANGNPQIFGKVDVPDTGFIAQDFIEAEDSIGMADYLQLSFRDNPDQLEITQGRLIPILVKAIQDLSAKIAELESK
jgi:hypothetical protein